MREMNKDERGERWIERREINRNERGERDE